MEDARINIRATLDVDNLEQNAVKYRKELTNLGTVTDKEGKVISTAWERVANAAKKSNVGRVMQEMTGDVSENIAIQKKVLTDLEQQYKEVAKAVENAAPGMAKNKLLSEMAAIKQEIDNEKQALTELQQVQNQYNQSNVSLRTQLMNVRNEMGQLELSGQKNSERYRELEGELGRLGTAYRKLEYEQKAFSTGATQWGGIISGIQGVAGAFAAAQGTIGLFVSDNEKLAKIQTRLQAVMAITIGMQQVSNTLHETSAFRMTTVRRVTELYSAAQTKLATSLGVSATMAKVLMASLTFGLSAVITGVIALISKLSSAQKKAAEEQKHIIEVQKKAAESAGEQRATYEKLANEWNNLGDNLESKKKFIEANKSEFEKLGLSIDKVNDAENLFTKNKEAFILSLDQRAKAMAAMELAMEKYKEAYNKQKQLDNTSKTKTKITYSGSPLYGGQVSQTFVEENKEYTNLKNEIKKLNADASSFIKNQSDAMKEYYETLEKAGIKVYNQDLENAKKKEEERLRLIQEVNQKIVESDLKLQNDRLAVLSDSRTKQLAQIDLESRQKLAAIDKEQQELAKKYKETGNGNLPENVIATYNLRRENINAESAKKRFDIIYKYNTEEEKLYEQLTDVFLTEEERKTKAVQARYDEMRKAAREQYDNEISAIDTTKTGSEKEFAIKEVKQKYEEKTTLINAAQAREELNTVLEEYKGFQQQRLEIETKYNNDIQKLQQQLTKSTDEEEKKRLQDSIKVAEEKKKAELSGIDLQEFKKEIDWSSVFGNLDKLSTDALKRLRDKIKEYLSTVGEGINKEDLKTVVDAFENLDTAIANRTPINELVAGYKEYKSAVDEVREAKKALDKADNPEAKAKATQDLSDAEKKRAESLSKMTQSVNAIGQQGQQLVGAGNDIISMLTNLGIKVPEAMAGTLDGLGQVMDGLASIDLTKPMSAVTGVIRSLAGVTKMIGSVFGLGSDNGVGRYNALKEQLEAINAIYDKIIDKSKEKIKFGEGFASVKAADEALSAYYKKLANYQKLAEEGGKAGASSGSHSYAYRVNKRLSGQWDDMSKAIGKNISSIQDMYKLSGDQLYIIQTQFPEAWQKISPEIRDNLEAIIDCKDEAKELVDALNEAFTGVSFDGFYNGFIDSLSDMDASFEDMCDDFEGYLRKSIVAGLVASQYKGRIEQLYKSWADAAKSGNEIDEDEANALRNEYQNIIKDIMKDREEMANSFGWEASQEQVKSQTGVISETITEKTASEMTGIWRGSYDTLKGIYNVNTSFYESYKSTMSICNGILSRIADNTGITANNTSVLSEMNQTMNRMDGRLRTLESNANQKYI